MLGARTKMMQAYKHSAFFNSEAAWLLQRWCFGSRCNSDGV